MNRFSELRSLRCLAGVSDQAVEWLSTNVEERRYGTGDVLIREGETDRDCYFIVEGDTEVRAGGSVVGASGAGEPEGEMAMFFRRPRGATTTVTSPVRAFVLSADDWDSLEGDAPGIANDIRAGMLQHLGRRFGAAPPRAP